nr:MAG TPA: hypothetical protein [Caudoviricetes sp.]
MAKKKYKLGWGEENKITSAIKNGLLDGGDLVITKDTKRIAFIDPNGNLVHFLKNRLITFDNLEDAKSYANTNKDAYAGELISVLIGDKQKTYRLQNAETGYSIEDIDSCTDNLKQYVQVVDVFPEIGQEEGIIYISNTIGKIWTGTEWRTVFEDITPIKEELDKKAPLNNPEFSGIIKVDGEEIALKSYVEQLVTNLPSQIPGTVDSKNQLPETGYKAGQTWRVVEDGTYAGQKCEIGDLIICVNDYADNYSDDDFIIVQANISGAVTGTDSSADGEIVIFSGVSGKAIKNSGINIDVIEDLISKSHEHANKEILDTYTKTEEQLLQEAEDTVYAVYEDIRNRLVHIEPYVEGNYLYANGHGLIIEAVDENTNKAIYYLSGQKKELTFKTDGVIIGGAKDDNCHSSSIVMNSGNVGIIHGGSFGNGDVAESNIVINGGTIECIYGGGHPELNVQEYANHTGHTKIIVNNVSGTCQIFGGGYSYATTGSAEIIVNKGNFSYITAGGSNGYTANGMIVINDGTVQCVQSVNRGSIGHAVIKINGGTCAGLYAGVEPGGEATGSFGHTELYLLGGEIQKLAKGLNNNVEDYDATECVSGKYRTSVVNQLEAEAVGLKLASEITHTDIDHAKDQAIAEAKTYINSSLALVEF